MFFRRMGEVKLSDLELCPILEPTDGSFLKFELLNLASLERAHFYDDVKKASISIYLTYQVQADCVMKSGHVVHMEGCCTPNEYQELKNRYQEAAAC